jgi:hypothetical protein
MVDTRISNLSKTLTLIDLAFLDNKGNYPICRLVGSEVIRESWMLTTALSLGAAVSKANSNVNNAHFFDVNFW